MPEPVLDVSGLSKRFGDVQALDGIDLQVRPGEVFGFLGPNGAGKTTFTKCVTGFIHRDAGSVEVCGMDPERHPADAARFVGLVPDQYDFYPGMTGRQHLEYYASLHRMPKEDRRSKIEDVLGVVGMTDRADRKMKGYSHGMKQRICIAQAIIHRPRLVILDEPTNGLDPKGAYELRRLIKRIAKAGSSVFLNSHVLHEVEDVCERVAIVNRGRLVAVDHVEELRRTVGGPSHVVFRLNRPSGKALAAARSIHPGAHPAGTASIRIPMEERRVPQALRRLMAAGVNVVGVEAEKSSLEDLFLKLTEEAP